MADIQAFTKLQRAAHAVCENDGDVATTGLREISIDETERRTWFLFETAQGGAHTH